MLRVFLCIGTRAMIVKYWGELLLVLGLTSLRLLHQREFRVGKCNLLFELDYLSWALILLSVWVVSLCLKRRVKIKLKNVNRGRFAFRLISLLLRLILVFSVSDTLFFYVIFECCLIPVFLLILGWGYQPERIQAGTYLVFYTVLGSFPLFTVILVTKIEIGSTYLYNNLHSFRGAGVFIFFVSAFLVKFPIYGVHLWLLKAHVEAPVAGSMVLAGVLLKLGGYGLLRVLSFWGERVNLLNEIVVVISIWGGVVVALSCLRQLDIKLLVASSSVVHMRMCIGALFIFRELGVKGCLMIMIAHGLCSSGLFFLANVVYERTHRRRLFVSKGLLNLIPSLSFWWFVLLACNIAAPPSLNLVREVLLLRSLVGWDLRLLFGLALMSFLRAAYRLFLFSLRQHGVFLMTKSGFSRTRLMELYVATAHWIPVNVVVLYCGLFTCWSNLNKILCCGHSYAHALGSEA